MFGYDDLKILTKHFMISKIGLLWKKGRLLGTHLIGNRKDRMVPPGGSTQQGGQKKIVKGIRFTQGRSPFLGQSVKNWGTGGGHTLKKSTTKKELLPVSP